MNRTPARIAYALAIVSGVASWFLVAHFTNRREAWDSELYFSVVLPALGLLAAVLAFAVPEKPWRWAFGPFGGQALAAFIQNPAANLLPLGLVVFAVFGAFCLVPAYLGAWLRRLVRRA
jgi:hypothetical protein